MPAKRGAVPSVLADPLRNQQWTQRWGAQHANKRNFRWPRVANLRVNVHLRPDLEAMTGKRCAYCDRALSTDLELTVDHFEPKSVHPAKAFDWDNLFPACVTCQTAKQENFDALALKPDVPGYDFARYFEFDALTGQLNPNRQASASDRDRALATIRLFGLNENGQPQARCWYLKLQAETPIADPWPPYRFTR